METFSSNVSGTINVLESLRQLEHSASVCNVIIVTSDKCYRNLERNHPYVETDQLGGLDPYSCSKAMVELAVESYRHSFFPPKPLVSESPQPEPVTLLAVAIGQKIESFPIASEHCKMKHQSSFVTRQLADRGSMFWSHFMVTCDWAR